MASKIITAVGGAVVSVSIAVASCTAAGTARPGSAAGHVRSSHAPKAATAGHKPRAGRPAHPRTPGADQVFGPGCRRLLHNGRSRPAELAGLPLTAALERIPQLSDLARAIRLAGLTTRLESTRPLTIFAPDNGAFAYIGAGSLHALLATKPDLGRVLTFQMVQRQVIPADLARHRVLKTLGRTKVYPAGSGSTLSVNNALVGCGNLRTADATIYIVNRLIIPAR